MKCARRHDRTISLHTYSREHYQFLHDEGKKGHLSCPYCGQPVFFRLNIHEEPAFIHKQTSQQEMCEKAEEQEDNMKKKKEPEESASYKELAASVFQLANRSSRKQRNRMIGRNQGRFNLAKPYI